MRDGTAQPTQELTFEVPPQPLHDFGLVDEDGADHGGAESIRRRQRPDLKAGDVIEQVDGKRLGEGANPAEAWDAETLPDYLRRAADDGREVEFTVQRAPESAKADEAKIRVKPQLPTMMNIVIPPRRRARRWPSNEIGIAYRIRKRSAGGCAEFAGCGGEDCRRRQDRCRRRSSFPKTKTARRQSRSS